MFHTLKVFITFALMSFVCLLTTNASQAENIVLKCNSSFFFPINGFGNNGEVSEVEFLVKLDTENETGFYTGPGPINPYNPGSLEITSDYYILRSSRKTKLANRWVVEEYFDVNRFTGAILHHIILDDRHTYSIYFDGKCKKMDKQLF